MTIVNPFLLIALFLHSTRFIFILRRKEILLHTLNTPFREALYFSILSQWTLRTVPSIYASFYSLVYSHVASLSVISGILLIKFIHCILTEDNSWFSSA